MTARHLPTLPECDDRQCGEYPPLKFASTPEPELARLIYNRSGSHIYQE